MKAAAIDLKDRLKCLIFNGFLTITPSSWFTHLPRYVKAYGVRHRKLTAGGTTRDQANAAIFKRLWDRYLEAAERGDDPEVQRLRWMLEELHVSLFAQELKTSLPISPQRVEQQLAKILISV